MKRQTKYYARFFNAEQVNIEAFMIQAYNPKQGMDRAIREFELEGNRLGEVAQVIISRADDPTTALAAWVNKEVMYPQAANE